jgi:hypothetical protein
MAERGIAFILLILICEKCMPDLPLKYDWT